MAKIKKITPLLFLFSGLIVAFYFDFDKYVDFQFLQTHQGIVKGFITDMPVQAALLYMSLYAVSTAFSLPFGTIMTISGGWLFGVLIGGILTVIGATIGACTLFLAARYAFREAMVARAGARLQQFEAGFKRHSTSYLLAMRLIPVFPFFLVNFLPALIGVRLRTYALTTLVGIMPGTFVYAGLGNGLSYVLSADEPLNTSVIFSPSVFLPLCGLGFLSLLPVIWNKIKG
ncbi:MAG TPA: TVP38/TMEM64 family protein [Rhodobiaceae bacterium]|nr:TVP38/TMEM64 family protein [Rhodobiaceae bacterium]